MPCSKYFAHPRLPNTDPDARPSSSGSVVFHPNAPKTFIYPPRQLPASRRHDIRSSSSGTVIYYPDAPVTIIYPPRDRIRTPRLTSAKQLSATTTDVADTTKRKRAESPPSQAEEPSSKTYALVVLLQKHNLAMATDFAAFRKVFEAQGILAEYRSLYDLDEIIEVRGDLSYGRDHLPGRSREIVLTKGHENFYSIVDHPRMMKHGIPEWLQSVVPMAEENDNILLVLISHGTKTGSVAIGGEKASAPVEYLTNIDIRQAVANLSRYTYFTLINTCCYSGGWIDIARTSLGRRFVHAPTGKDTRAENFITSSGQYRRELFVAALLECLKRNGDGTLSEFIAEIKAEVTSYGNPKTPEEIPAAPTNAVSRSTFGKRPLNAFIPIQTDSNLSETVSAALEDIKSVTLAQLFQQTRPTKRREVIPDEMVREIREAQNWASRRGYSNGEGDIYHACHEVLDGNAQKSAKQAVLRTISWRERTMLQAGRIARHLEEIGIIKSDMTIDIDDNTLTKDAYVYCNRVFSGSKILHCLPMAASVVHGKSRSHGCPI